MGTNTMHVHRMEHALAHTHKNLANIVPVERWCTHIQTHVHSMQGVNLFSAHTLAFNSSKLLVCMFKRTLVLFSISVWTELLYS